MLKYIPIWSICSVLAVAFFVPVSFRTDVHVVFQWPVPSIWVGCQMDGKIQNRCFIITELIYNLSAFWRFWLHIGGGRWVLRPATAFTLTGTMAVFIISVCRLQQYQHRHRYFIATHLRLLSLLRKKADCHRIGD